MGELTIDSWRMSVVSWLGGGHPLYPKSGNSSNFILNMVHFLSRLLLREDEFLNLYLKQLIEQQRWNTLRNYIGLLNTWFFGENTT